MDVVHKLFILCYLLIIFREEVLVIHGGNKVARAGFLKESSKHSTSKSLSPYFRFRLEEILHLKMGLA